jgi:hypothetical protein
MRDEVLLTEAGFNCNHASHRLSDQCRRAVHPRHYVAHQIFKAGNRGVNKCSTEAWIRHENFVGSIGQLKRQRLPEIAIPQSSGKKK